MKTFWVIALWVALAGCADDGNSTNDARTQCSALPCSDGGVQDSEDASQDLVAYEDAEAPDGTADAGIDAASDAVADVNVPVLAASGAGEADVLYGWVAAAQPSEARVREVVATGAVIISLRLAAEDPFDEPGLVESLGGTFIRYPTTSSDYDSQAFREAMYDLYDAQLDAGKIVYLHCASSNRVGASWALYQAERKGVPAEEAIAMGKAAGLTSLESLVRGVLGV